jgi:hypothetical protein
MSPMAAPDRLVVVAVSESVNPALAGRDSITYVSPPQTLDAAGTLAQLLAGTAHDRSRCGAWTIPIPGGTRTVSIADEGQAG